MNQLHRKILAKIIDLYNVEHSTRLPTLMDITDLILIVGSSRSGTTLIHHLLSQHPEINSLPGEDSSYVKLFTGFQVDNFNFNDQINGLEDQFNNAILLLLNDIGNNSKGPPSSLETLKRFSFQHPEIFLNYSNDELLKILEEEINYTDFLKKFNILNNLYENNTVLHAEFNPKFLIEDPPFINPSKRTYQKQERNILLLKASSNVYRLKMFEKLFSHTKIHYIYANRSPEESINGLYDGWQSNAFHSYKIQNTTLKIKDYSDNNWWKFDLPPNWEQYTQSPLAEVCRFQWESANLEILKHIAKKRFYTIKYHDLFDSNSLYKKLNLIMKHLNINSFNKIQEKVPQVMTTFPPSKDRWLKRSNLILEATNKSNIQDLKNHIMELPFENN